MKLLILGKPFDGWMVSNPKYRGVDRSLLPSDIGHFAPEHELQEAVNLRFDSAIEPGLGPLGEPQLAQYILNTFNKYCPSEHFELVEIVPPGEKSKCSDEFLGYDLTPNYGDSLITNFLDPEVITDLSELHEILEILK